MISRNSVKLYSSIAVIVVAAGLLFIFRSHIFTGSKEKILTLLHLHKKIEVEGDTQTINSNELLGKYYNMFGSTAVQDALYRGMLIQMLNHADSLGLNRNDYHSDYLIKYDSLAHLPGFDEGDYESENEIIFTDAALSFLYNVAYGKEISRIEYNGIKYNIDSARILRVFNDLRTNYNWRRALDSIEPKIPQYLLLKAELNHMNAVLQQYPFLDSFPAGTGKYITQLKLKAYHLIPDTLCEDTVDVELFASAVKELQRMNSMDTTGVLDDKTFQQLNFSLKTRIEQIKESLNCWRWTGRLREKEFILVNIPAARLQIVSNDSVKDMSMKVIVGREETQTPSFTAYVTRVITYPFWTVPLSIATNEMLPKIQKRIAYLEDNSIQVINGKGDILDPATINWKKLTKNYFPYTLRQSTGCDNSLGVLKFDLNSPFSIYLHDTNHRNLFANKNRFMSHGCVRVEKPMELANYLLDERFDSTTITMLNSCLKDQKPSEFALKKKFPVLFLYMTADIDENGRLKFYKDVYKLDKVVS